METTPLPDDQNLHGDIFEWRLDDGADNILNSLVATTQAEMEMHATARVALLNVLLADPTVDELYWRWMHATPFGRAVYEYIEHLSRTAEATGFASAGELLRNLTNAVDSTITIQARDEADAARIARELQVGVAEASRLLDQIIEACKQLEPEPLVDESVGLVWDEWQLPWPWLALELVDCWMMRMYNIAFNTGSVLEIWVESNEAERPSPAIEFHFEATPDEAISATFHRFLREAIEAVMKPLERAASPLPRGRLTDEAIAARYVGWWYRKTVLKESVRSIADKEDGKRALVRYGIRQAERWLSVSNCVWRDDAA
jgi:hypothetical protein